MKNAFHFILRTLYTLKIFNFCTAFFGHVGKRLKKLRLISNFMMSSTGKKLITVNILPNISRRKGNQTVKFGQSIEYTVKNIFLQKSCRKRGRETGFRSLLFLRKPFT